jgi:hypothetical protein
MNSNTTHCLANAGEYVGPAAIVEYLGFVSTASPYIDYVDALTTVQFQSVNTTDSTCVVIFSTDNTYGYVVLCSSRLQAPPGIPIMSQMGVHLFHHAVGISLF